jgi:predicted DNA-binding ribbon-helix-helix protein
MIVQKTYIPGTSRQRVVFDDGNVMSRQYVYLEEHQWANLKKLAALQGVGGSQVIGRLIDLATNFKKPR